jgi:two-component system alkaline phosphatase synthesis response regulator PhoP
VAEAKAKAKILIVEDEKNLAEGLAYNLRLEGYEPAVARDGREALRMFGEGGWALIILDLMLPYVDGIEVAQRIRQKDPQIPILMLTAKGKEEDRIEGLASGADDYVTKPFRLEELLLRIKGMIRRRSWYREIPPAGSLYYFGDTCWVDFFHRKAMGVAGERDLTETEAAILRLLVEHEGEVVRRAEMLAKIWGYSEEVETRTVDNFIRRLRTYFEADPSRPRHIVSVRGVGYKFVR